MSKIISSIDIGSSKIVCLMAVVNDDKKICIKSASIHESKGIRNGNVVDINSAVRAIFETRIKAEKLINKNISVLAVNISGDSIKSKNIRVSLKLPSGKVSKNSIITLARGIDSNLKKSKKAPIHLVVNKMFIDDTEVRNPSGIIGNKLRADFYSMYVDILKHNNLSACFKNNNLKVNNYVFSAFASSLAVLTDYERQSGSLVIDMGAGLTSFCIIKDKKFIYGNSIPIAGNSITKDIAEILKINMVLAEKVKILNTNFYMNTDEENEIINIDIDSEDSYRIAETNIKTINDIAKARIEEIIFMILKTLNKKKLDKTFNNIVITGGTANIYGLDNFVTEITKIKTRIGVCDKIYTSSNLDENKIINPIYSTSIGLLYFLNRFYGEDALEDYKGETGVFNKVVNFLVNLFIA